MSSIFRALGRDCRLSKKRVSLRQTLGLRPSGHGSRIRFHEAGQCQTLLFIVSSGSLRVQVILKYSLISQAVYAQYYRQHTCESLK
jgi:hypothetical protein